MIRKHGIFWLCAIVCDPMNLNFELKVFLLENLEDCDQDKKKWNWNKNRHWKNLECWKNLRSWNVFNLVFFVYSTIHHMLAVLLLESPCVIIFFIYIIIYICAFHAWYAIICQWNKGLYLLLHLWDIESRCEQGTLWILGSWLMLCNTVVKNL